MSPAYPAQSAPASTKVPDNLAESFDWERANELASAAAELDQAAEDLRSDGDLTWRNKAREAQMKLEEAVAQIDPWVSSLQSQYGTTHPEVKAFMRIRERWRVRAVELRKLL